MPKAKKHPCSFGGCNVLTHNARCEAHTSVVRSRSRAGVKRQRMYNHESWRTLRKRILTDDPLCKHCHGLATVVDHIVPHRGDLSLFWDTINLQPLCKPCHDRKTGSGE